MSKRPPILTVDFETYSELDVRDVGAACYAEHPSTEILCLRWRMDREGAYGLWTPDLPFPQELIDAATDGITVFEAHNTGFEFWIWYWQLHKKIGIPIPVKWTDTLASCAYRGLPLGLEEVGSVLELPVQKDKRGKYLLQKLSQPRKPTAKEKKAWAVEHPGEPMPVLRCEEWGLYDELYDYCGQDVGAEQALSDKIGFLPKSEYQLWRLDQKINARGVQVDLEAVHAAIKIVVAVEEKLEAELSAITGGFVETGGQVARIIEWLEKQGCNLPNLTKDTIEDAFNDPDYMDSHVPEVRRVLQIRQYLSRASTKKLYKILECACADGRLRGMLQYHGSQTGRWAGRLAQPHNFPRGDKDCLKNGIEALIAAIKLGTSEALDLFYKNPMEAIATSLRGMFIAAPGKTLRVADFSAIEARVTMWLADQEDALDAFRQYDQGIGPDIYCVMASKLYNRPIDKVKDSKERQLGKISVLGCGYGLGVDKMIFQAWKDYKVRLTEETASLLVYGYRNGYPKVKYLWYGLEEAAINAVENPGKIYRYGKVAYQTIHDAAGNWLTCILPNGRRIWYYEPNVNWITVTYKDGEVRRKQQLSYQGRDNKKGGRWSIVYTYGGMLTENTVQAIARDFMAEAMLRVEAAGYEIILTVHDEIVCETLIDFGSKKEFEELMIVVPEWGKGCPIAVEGWVGPRYKKA